MKAPDVIHVHKRADLWLIRDPFFICIAKSLLKNRQNSAHRGIKDKNVLFPFLITMWHDQLVRTPGLDPATVLTTA